VSLGSAPGGSTKEINGLWRNSEVVFLYVPLSV